MKFFLSILLAISLLASPGMATAEIRVVSEANTYPAVVAEVEQTVKTFNSVLKETMNASLDVDMNIFVCPNRDILVQVIEREQQIQPTQRSVPSEAYVFGSPKKQSIFINAETGATKENYERAELLSMFLVRQWQYELRGKKVPNEARTEVRGILDAFFWMDQGVADYIGAMVAEKRGFRSVEKWKTERVEFLSRFYSAEPFSLNEMHILSVRSWAMWLIKQPVYKADLITARLLEQETSKRLLAIPDYYSQSGSTENVKDQWEKAFGLNYEKFTTDFINWYNGNLVK